MAITRSQIARQLYQFGGGADAGGKDSPGGGDFGGFGDTGGKGGDGGSTAREKGIMSRGKGPKGTTGDIRDFQDTGPDDRSNAIQNYTQSLVRQGYSPKQINQMFNRPNFFQRMVRNPFVRAGLFAVNPMVGKFASRDILKGIDVARNIKSIYDNPTLEVPETFFDEDKEVDTNLDEDKEVDTNLEDLAESVRNMPDLMDKTTKTKSRAEELLEEINMANGGRAGLAEGGMPYEGGIMDLESARQMYGLGKLVKKVTRTVKKIAKSPIGKAALIGGGLGLAGIGPFSGLAKTKLGTALGGFFGKGSFNPLLRKVGGDFAQSTFGSMLSGIPGGGVTAAIAGTSLLAGLLTPEQEEEAQLISDETGIDIEAARNQILAARQDDFRARRFRAEGGSMKEPVAKKTMPLLDMGGQEMDLRAEGGFVPIGRMEKADDVPARLSKNEFVFTADAVRNAGDGDVDKGAEVMYNMMKNLEAGGEVSKESQGLEGARKMFQTSQRLEEVL